jgi:hypothetical protein
MAKSDILSIFRVINKVLVYEALVVAESGLERKDLIDTG